MACWASAVVAAASEGVAVGMGSGRQEGRVVPPAVLVAARSVYSLGGTVRTAPAAGGSSTHHRAGSAGSHLEAWTVWVRIAS